MDPTAQQAPPTPEIVNDDAETCSTCPQTKGLFACIVCSLMTCVYCPYDALAGSTHRKRYGGNGQSLETTREQGYCMHCRPDMTCCGTRIRAPHEKGVTVGRKWKMTEHGYLGEEVPCRMNIGLLHEIDPDDKIGRAFVHCPHCNESFCYFENPDQFQEALWNADDISVSIKRRYAGFRGCVKNPTAFLGGSTGKKKNGRMELDGNGCGNCRGSRKVIQYLTNKESRFQEVDKDQLQMSGSSSGSPSSGSDGEYEPALEEKPPVVNKYWRWHAKPVPKREDKVYDPTKDRKRYAKTARGDYKLIGGSVKHSVKHSIFKGVAPAAGSHKQRRKRAANEGLEKRAEQFRPNGKAAATSYDDPYQQGDGKSVGLYGGFGDQVLAQQNRFDEKAESVLANVQAQEQRDIKCEEKLRAEILARGEQVPSDDLSSSEGDT